MITPGERLILIAGASGYVGARLAPRLLAGGYHLRILARTPEKIAGQPWGEDPHLEIFLGDVLDPASLIAAMRGCQAAFYLVHSLGEKGGDFAALDRRAAGNFAAAAAAAGIERIIFLSGLGEDDGKLSEHLRSRAEIAAIFRQGKTPATILRAGVILGSGSASFEILRYLVDRLPVMVTPRWIDTPCQPISIVNVLNYLVGVLALPETIGQTYDIGQEEVITYSRLMELYAEEAGLRRRLVIPVPVLTPRLSSYWINLVTPLPARLARPLVEGLRNPVLCQETRIRRLIPQHLLDGREAIHNALAEIRSGAVASSWRESGALAPAAWRGDSDPRWAGGTSYVDRRSIEIAGERLPLWQGITCLGGRHGWYFANFLWQLRGGIDRLLGGVGLQRGRRCPLDLRVGDALDFWRVAKLEKEVRLLLVAEMKLPGVATLEFTITPLGEKRYRLLQTARFFPRGLAGILYWYAILPAHHFVFNGMLLGIAAASNGEIKGGPQRLGAGKMKKSVSL